MSDAGDGGFVKELADLAAIRDWKTWNKVRLVYADWLAEHRPEDEAITRASWEFRWQRRYKDGAILESWRVLLPMPLTNPPGGWSRLDGSLAGRLNRNPLLHFAPRKLKFLLPCLVEGRVSSTVSVAYFTHFPGRVRSGWLDWSAAPGGFRKLFQPQMPLPRYCDC